MSLVLDVWEHILDYLRLGDQFSLRLTNRKLRGWTSWSRRQRQLFNCTHKFYIFRHSPVLLNWSDRLCAIVISSHTITSLVQDGNHPEFEWCWSRFNYNAEEYVDIWFEIIKYGRTKMARFLEERNFKHPQEIEELYNIIYVTDGDISMTKQLFDNLPDEEIVQIIYAAMKSYQYKILKYLIFKYYDKIIFVDLYILAIELNSIPMIEILYRRRLNFNYNYLELAMSDEVREWFLSKDYPDWYPFEEDMIIY